MFLLADLLHIDVISSEEKEILDLLRLVAV